MTNTPGRRPPVVAYTPKSLYAIGERIARERLLPMLLAGRLTNSEEIQVIAILARFCAPRRRRRDG